MSKLLLVLGALLTLLTSSAVAQDAATLASPAAAAAPASAAAVPAAAFVASDPGVRGGDPGAGSAITGLKDGEYKLFADGQDTFGEVEALADGLGPRFNMDSCLGCHAQPAGGGTSPAVNPQVTVATKNGAQNRVPFFVKQDGPVREARYQYKPDGTRDGGVHALFVISGRVDLPGDPTGDASGCNISQEQFGVQAQNGNLIFRIPTPVFGAGLIEQIPDGALVANQAASTSQKAALGILGKPNRVRVDQGDPNVNGNDGTIARFGWKAQNKSLLLFSGEAYNVEMGITNELFQTERDEKPACQFKTVPNDATNTETNDLVTGLSDIEKFALFMRFLAPPTPSPDTPGGAQSIANGRMLFESVGCALCHTPTLRTGNSTVMALANQDVNLFSDLLLHNMGAKLADDIIQGQAGPDEFRTAPLWGLGQRIFFLHDGRTTDLIQAINAHRSPATATYVASEANGVVRNFNQLSEWDKQDLLNFLRSL